jgi:hypothetical protein
MMPFRVSAPKAKQVDLEIHVHSPISLKRSAPTRLQS